MVSKLEQTIAADKLESAASARRQSVQGIGYIAGAFHLGEHLSGVVEHVHLLFDSIVCELLRAIVDRSSDHLWYVSLCDLLGLDGTLVEEEQSLASLVDEAVSEVELHLEPSRLGG